MSETTATTTPTIDDAKKLIQENGTETSNAKGPVLNVPKSVIASFFDSCGVPPAMLQRVQETETLLNNAAVAVAGERLLDNINAKKDQKDFDPAAMRYTVRLKGDSGNVEMVVGGLKYYNNPQGGEKTAEYGWVRATHSVDRCFNPDTISNIQNQIKAALGQ